jgi:hypothetical protein
LKRAVGVWREKTHQQVPRDSLVVVEASGEGWMGETHQQVPRDSLVVEASRGGLEVKKYTNESLRTRWWWLKRARGSWREKTHQRVHKDSLVVVEASGGGLEGENTPTSP